MIAYQSILKSIKNKELLPIYFLHGEESYYIDSLLNIFENDILTEDEKDFGLTIIYGKDSTYAEIISLAKQVPMFGSYNLIIIKEAQDLTLNENAENIFLQYVENPIETTILVFGHPYKSLDKRKKITKILHSKGYLFQSDAIKDWNLPTWIIDKAKEMNLKLAPNINFLLADFLGNNLTRISNELQKIQMILPKDEILNAEMVERHIGISKEFNIFELQKAIAARDVNISMKIIHFMNKNPKSNPLVRIIANLYYFFSELIMYHTIADQSPQKITEIAGIKPFTIKNYAAAKNLYPLKHCTKIITVLREYDMKSKGLGANQTPDNELLKEMVYKILNIGMLKN